MINAYLNNNIGFSVAAGDTYGPELYVAANAASDPSGNEANATTGWTPSNLSGTGSNVFESQSSIVHTGSYAIHANANPTPTASAQFTGSLAGVENGSSYLIEYYARHVGSGSSWRIYINAGAGYGNIVLLESTDTTFVKYSKTVTMTATTIFFLVQTTSTSGGVYLDNLSVRKIL